MRNFFDKVGNWIKKGFSKEEKEKDLTTEPTEKIEFEKLEEEAELPFDDTLTVSEDSFAVFGEENTDDEDDFPFGWKQYRECKIRIDSDSSFFWGPMELEDEEGNVCTVSIDGDTVLLNVNKPGEYTCIYYCRRRKKESVIKGRALCIADEAVSRLFSSIEDPEEKAKNMKYYSLCSDEQKEYFAELFDRGEAESRKDFPSESRRRQRDVITDIHALKMMYAFCKHALPVNLQFRCKQLIQKIDSSRNKSAATALADILYTCCGSAPKKPFLSAEACLEVFRKRRYGDDPWIKDMIRQIRLLDRCEHSGTVFVLVGGPGTGKTEIGEAIAECTKKKYCIIDCRNKNAMEMGGSNDTYTDSHHGEVQENLTHYGEDCCILLDEFEKMVITEKEGNPFSLFVSTWDDRKTFTDSFTAVPVPTHNVIWILTVNSIEKVPDYILNRFHENVFVLDSYSAQTKAEIGKRFIVPKCMNKYNFTEQEVRFTDDGLMAIAKSTSDDGARVTAQRIEKVLSIANEWLENGCTAPVVINSSFALNALSKMAPIMEKQSKSIGF